MPLIPGSILGLAVVVVAGLGLAGLARQGGAYRVGPWPGLTARGGLLLLVCAGLLVGCELLLPRSQQAARALPDLPLLAALALVPPLLATCLVRAPGCASAVCGVYLLARSLASLGEPRIEPPPLVLPAALAFDLLAWARRSDVADLWPWRPVWRVRRRPPRQLTGRRAALAGAAFGLVLALVEPPFALLLGSDPAGWSTADRLLAGLSATLAGGALGLALKRITNRLAGRAAR